MGLLTKLKGGLGLIVSTDSWYELSYFYNWTFRAGHSLYSCRLFFYRRS